MLNEKYEHSSKKFATAIFEIDKSIEHLKKTKYPLLGTENRQGIAHTGHQKNINRNVKKIEQVRVGIQLI
jgi:hypothetical protein